MASIKSFWRKANNNSEQEQPAEDILPVEPTAPATMLDLDIAGNDPLAIYLQSNPGVVEVNKLLIDSPAVRELRDSGARLVVPLVSQGELIGLINLGPRLSEQEYSADDRKLLNDLASQAAPAVRVAQLARQQQAEARERERLEQELQVARLIQQTLLPQSLPDLTDYDVGVYYQPAREVGGDFYDFIYLDDDRVGFIIGDVTDKGVPAALVMATTRTLLRAAAERLESPGKVLERVNDLLYPDIPARMFVTCLYAILDLNSGCLQYANAGHDLPYLRREDGAEELRATGMPLGLMPGMDYEEKEVTIGPGETVLLYSDGLAEAHAPDGDMYGFPRLQNTIGQHAGGVELIDYLLDHLAGFTGPEWEQEDDVTLLTLQRTHVIVADKDANAQKPEAAEWVSVAELNIPSEPGNERQAMEEVAKICATMALPPDRFEKLKTAVAEATMNAMEHGNKYQVDVPVQLEVLTTETAVAVRISDQGGGQPATETELPDLEAKLAGQQSPRGWGLFLIKNMVDEMNITEDGPVHTVELVVNLGEGE